MMAPCTQSKQTMGTRHADQWWAGDVVTRVAPQGGIHGGLALLPAHADYEPWEISLRNGSTMEPSPAQRATHWASMELVAPLQQAGCGHGVCETRQVRMLTRSASDPLDELVPRWRRWLSCSSWTMGACLQTLALRILHICVRPGTLRPRLRRPHKP